MTLQNNVDIAEVLSNIFLPKELLSLSKINVMLFLGIIFSRRRVRLKWHIVYLSAVLAEFSLLCFGDMKYFGLWPTGHVDKK